MKSYTDLEQSKKLTEILPLESADMYYVGGSKIPDVMYGCKQDYRCYTICWSIAALLNILPDGTNVIKDKSDTENEKYMCVAESKDDIISTFGNNPVDACYQMVIKLKETT